MTEFGATNVSINFGACVLWFCKYGVRDIVLPPYTVSSHCQLLTVNFFGVISTVV